MLWRHLGPGPEKQIPNKDQIKGIFRAIRRYRGGWDEGANEERRERGKWGKKRKEKKRGERTNSEIEG